MAKKKDEKVDFATVKAKLEEAGVTDEAIVALETEGYDTEAALRETSKDDLKDAGVTKGGDRAKIKATFPTPTTTAPTTPPAQPGITDAGLVAAMREMGTQFAQAQQLADSHLCGSCGKPVPKEYPGEYCPYCAGPMTTGVTSCPICATEVPTYIRGALVCINGECGAPLWDGEKADALRYLVKTGDSVRAAIKAVQESDTDSSKYKKWVREGRKISGPVLNTSKQAKEEAIAALASPANFHGSRYNKAKHGLEINARW